MVTLITGATGFLGRELRAYLKLDPSSEVHTCALNALSEWSNHSATNLTKKNDVEKLIRRIKPQRVYHLAGIARVSNSIEFADYFYQNTLSTQYILESITESGSPCDFFLASSVHVYGNQNQIVNERSEVKPAAPYGFTKLLAEETLKNFTLKHPQIRGVVGRLYSCIGPDQPAGFAASDICLKIKTLKKTNGTRLEVGPIDAIRQFTDVRDAIKTFPTLLDSKLPSRFEIFNIASQKTYEVKELIQLALKLEGLEATIASQSNDSNPFKGLKVDTTKLHSFVTPGIFRPLECSLKDILASTPG